MKTREKIEKAMRFALFEPDHSAKYKELFEQDRVKLFPSNSFPPNPRDKVAHQALDDICDYLPWYYQFGVLQEPLEKYQACVKFVTETMDRHAALYGLCWVQEEDPHDPGKQVYYLSRTSKIEEVE